MQVLASKQALEAAYHWGFVYSQSPVLLDYVARLQGIRRPSFSEDFNYCEIGCANGVTVNLLAAGYPHGHFYGMDLNAAAIDNAQDIAAKGKLSNAEFIASTYNKIRFKGTPKFDYITLHDIYTSIGEDERQDIIKFMKKYLKPTGIVCLSYNATPGWSEFVPLRQIMMTHEDSVDGNLAEKIRAGMEYLKKLRQIDVACFRGHPRVQAFFETLLDKTNPYLAHEFFDPDWSSKYFHEVANNLKKAKLEFFGSAELIKNHPEVIPKALWEDLERFNEMITLESHKSLILGENFRYDLYHRSERRIVDARENIEYFNDLIIGPEVLPEELEKEAVSGRYKMHFQQPIFKNLMSLFAQGDKTVREVRDDASLREYSDAEVILAIHRLLAGGIFEILLKKMPQPEGLKIGKLFLSNSINRAMLNTRLLKDSACYLSSPVFGSALKIGLIDGLFLRAMDQEAPDEIISSVLAVLEASSHDWKVEGKEVPPEQRHALVADQWEAFQQKRIPLFYRFGILEKSDDA